MNLLRVIDKCALKKHSLIKEVWKMLHALTPLEILKAHSILKTQKSVIKCIHSHICLFNFV